MTDDLIKKIHELDEDAQIDTIEKILSGITLGTCVKLVPYLEEKWDVEATPNFGGMLPGPVEEEEAEQTEFSVILTGNGAKKIQVIKAIRSLTMIDLKASKALTDALPATIKEKLPKEEADRFKAQLEEAGATIEIK